MLERAAGRERFRLQQIAMRRSFAEDVRDGLQQPQKELQPWYFYDAIGSALFTAITELPEYTITRAETEILRRNGAQIARAFRSPERIVELGSGDGRKTVLLLDALIARHPRLTFIPIDVDGALLELTARALLSRFPALRVDAIAGDYRNAAAVITPGPRTVVLFLGSSIGNLDPAAAVAMLRDVRGILGRDDSVFLGADLQKPKAVVEAAYNDALGITAAFNLNLLARINRELGGHFDLSQFEHRAFLNEEKSRIEMHLVSRVPQTVAIDALRLQVRFEKSETIHTENSYKYAQSDLERIATESGFAIEESWSDASARFSDFLMVAR